MTDLARDLAPLAGDPGAAELVVWAYANALRPGDACLVDLDAPALSRLVEVLVRAGHLPFDAPTRALAPHVVALDPDPRSLPRWVALHLATWREGQAITAAAATLRAACVEGLAARPGPGTRALRAALGVLEAASASAPHATSVFFEEALDALGDLYGDERVLDALYADGFGEAVRKGYAALVGR